MDDLSNLQNQVNTFLTLPIRKPPAPARAALAPDLAVAESAVAPPSQRFSPFDPAQLERATDLLDRFMALADSIPGKAGLDAVYEEANKAAASESPELVRYALMLFITHHPEGNQLKISPLEKRAAVLVLPSRPEALRLPAAALAEAPAEAPSEISLSWFREDPKANEHHEHWHLVYLGRGVRDPNNPNVRRLKDRQGELFLYMHEQMIARYDAERLAVGLAPVVPLDYTEQIPEAYDPDPHLEVDAIGGITSPFSSRPSGERIGDIPGMRVADLKRWGDNLLKAARSGSFKNGKSANADLLGASVEPTIGSIDTATYGNHHNAGHIFLAYINDPQNAGSPNDIPGVMSETRTAIRDPIFFRWHKHVDDISFTWQETRVPDNFADAPQVLMRKGLNGATPEHQSSDIILCFKDVILPQGGDDSDATWQAFGETNFGGANWDKDFSASDKTTGELQTAMRQRQFVFTEDDNKTETISYLYPREFFYFLRVENQLARAKDVTVRIFLAPAGSYAGIPEVAEDRRKWIEMDKFTYTLPAPPAQRVVIFRRADASSVIRKPAIKTFDPVQVPNPDDDTGDGSDPNCDCGWPYNLLLPRGTQQGMNFRLFVMITDYEKDRVPGETAPDETACEGSMSYCGAKNKNYPDKRPMGYPFARRFPAGQSIAQTIAAQKNMATRDITIKLVDSVPG